MSEVTFGYLYDFRNAPQWHRPWIDYYAEVLDVIRRLGAERHLGVVMVTHDFGVVADICDRVAVMRSGRIVEQGDVDEIFSAPREGYTRMLLASTLEDAVPGVPLRLDEEFA